MSDRAVLVGKPKFLEAEGVTECQVVPWFFYGGDPTALETQVESLARFADTVITEMET